MLIEIERYGIFPLHLISLQCKQIMNQQRKFRHNNKLHDLDSTTLVHVIPESLFLFFVVTLQSIIHLLK